MEQSPVKTLLGKSTAVMFLRVAGLLASFFFLIVISNRYGASVTGIYSLCIAVLQIFSLLAKLGTDRALLKLIAEDTAANNGLGVKSIVLTTLKYLLPVTLIVAAIFFFLAGPIAAGFYKKPYLEPYFKLFAVFLLPYVLLNVFQECLHGLKKNIIFSFLKFAALPSFALVFTLVFGVFTQSGRAPIWGYLVSILLSFAISAAAWLFSARSLSESSKDQKKTIRDIVSLSFPMLFSDSLTIILGWFTIVVLGRYVPDADVGVYRAVLSFSMLTTIPLQAINTVVAPRFAGLNGQREFSALHHLLVQSTKIIFWLSLPVLVVMLLLPKFLLGIINEEFVAGYRILQIIAIGKFASAISGSVGNFLLMTGRQKVFQNITVVVVILNCILCVAIIPGLGIDGAAFINLISTALSNLAMVVYIYIKMGVLTLYIPGITELINGRTKSYGTER